MRLIDADALREILLDEAKDTWNMDTHTSWADALEEVVSYVGEMPTITPTPRWIPVTERPPEEDGWVLVYMDGRPGAPWEIVYCYGGRWVLGCKAAKSITHWMPLPEPPKEATP